MKLARREKYIISLGIFFIAIFFFFQFMIFPFFEKRKQIQRAVRAKEQSLQEMAVLGAQYMALKKGSLGMKKILSGRKKGFTLFSFLEGAAGDSGVKDHIKYMKPSVSQGSGPYKESMVEMKLEEITLSQLVDYLHRIESPEDVVGIKRISIQENKREAGYLDAVLQVTTFL
jgi:general secretion pathway protein M